MQGSPQDLLQRLGMPGTALQQQGLSAFANLLAQPSPTLRADASLQELQSMLGGLPGGQVVSSALPVFQRNLGESLARQRDVGPRFASAAQREARTLEQQGLQDFNLFAAQALEQGRQRQLNEILGAFQGASMAQAPQMALIQQLLPFLFGGGLSQGVITGPSPFGQLAQAGGAAAAAYAGFPKGGGG